MTFNSEQQITTLIELAEKYGYREITFRPKEHVVSLLIGDMYAVMGLLFQPEFAKAIFGEEVQLCRTVVTAGSVEGNGGAEYWAEDDIWDWQFHLQQLAITPIKDRISYAFEHRRSDDGQSI